MLNNIAVYWRRAPTLMKMSLELGGNAPFCANRFYVQDGIYDAIAARELQCPQAPL